MSREWLIRGERFFQSKPGILALVTMSALLLLSSFNLPYWSVKLKAPQYPDGLSLHVYMDRVEGDVDEVNLLNHYIGMGKLNEAAQVERRYSWYGLLAVSLASFFLIPAGRLLIHFVYFPPIAFLLGFMGDFFYWLYRFGHELSPDAPVRIQPFTPTFIGPGKIGQFSTIAMFSWGFWMALAGTLVLFYAIRKKRRMCFGCRNPLVCDGLMAGATKRKATP